MERNEFAVDSIGACASSSTLTADVLCVVIEAACRLEAISSHKWQLVIGHKSLVTAAAMYLGFGDNDAVIKILNVLYYISTANSTVCFVFFSLYAISFWHLLITKMMAIFCLAFLSLICFQRN